MRFSILVCMALVLFSCSEAGDIQGGHMQDEAVSSPAPPAATRETADDVMSLLAKRYEGWPESSEGRPSLSISISKSDDSEFFKATVIQGGLLDDSVSESKDVLTVAQSNAGEWEIVELQQWRKCYRDPGAGWTKTACP